MYVGQRYVIFLLRLLARVEKLVCVFLEYSPPGVSPQAKRSCPEAKAEAPVRVSRVLLAGGVSRSLNTSKPSLAWERNEGDLNI